MKKLIAITVTCLLVISAGIVLAAEMKGTDQKVPVPAPGPGMKMEQIKGDWQTKRLEKMSADLDLTPPQKEKVAAIYQANEPQIRAIMDKMMADLRVINEATEQKVKDVLTPEQVKKYDQKKAERQKQMEEMKANQGKEQDVLPK